MHKNNRVSHGLQDFIFSWRNAPSKIQRMQYTSMKKYVCSRVTHVSQKVSQLPHIQLIFDYEKFPEKYITYFLFRKSFKYGNSPHLNRSNFKKSWRTSTMVKHALCDTLKVSLPPASIICLQYYYSGYMEQENSKEAACNVDFLPTEVWSIPSFFKHSKYCVQSFWRVWNNQQLPPYYCLV